MIRRFSWGLLACLMGPLCVGCMSSRDIVRAQNPTPEAVGIYHGDRGFETQKNRWLNKPRYTEISSYTGPNGTDQVRYRNMFHMPVDAAGNSVNPFANGEAGGYYSAHCGNGNCGQGTCQNCGSDCDDDSSLCRRCNPGGCGQAVSRDLHDG